MNGWIEAPPMASRSSLGSGRMRSASRRHGYVATVHVPVAASQLLAPVVGSPGVSERGSQVTVFSAMTPVHSVPSAVALVCRVDPSAISMPPP